MTKRIAKARKLIVSKETLNVLSDGNLQMVRGGMPTITRQSHCPTACTDC